jgi:hypothetical protein
MLRNGSMQISDRSPAEIPEAAIDAADQPLATTRRPALLAPDRATGSALAFAVASAARFTLVRFGNADTI